jgi:TRAP-type C4-dicarboxylate transport system substrate-binding protein
VIKSPWRSSDQRYETDLIKDVEAGRAQMGITASRAFDTVGIKSFQALQAPFLIDSVALERKVLASDIRQQMLDGIERSGLVGLAILPGPLRRPLGSANSFRSASDFRGRKIGIRASAVAAETLWALGAVPVVLPRDNNTSGLAGAEGHLVNLDEALPLRGATITGNVDFEPRPNVIFINRMTFESLTTAQRGVLIRAAARVQMTAAVYQPDGGAAQDLCRRGIKIVAASATDLAGLRAAVQPVYAALESDPSTKAFIQQITSIRDSLGGSPDAASCTTSAETGRTTQALTGLDGKWVVTYTRSQLFAAGADPSEDIPGNWGHFSLTFDRGHFSDAGPDVGPGSGAASGTYVVNGDDITFYRTDNAYPGSDTEIWGPYTWSVYRDTLTFRKSGSFGEGPTGLVVKPWRRSASTG